jgi:hypothetical protein
VDKQAGILADQSIALNGYQSRKHYPSQLRRIRFRDPETGKNLIFLTNRFTLPAAAIRALYKSRWQAELFFKWIEQHLRIKAFYGTSENAVKARLRTAIPVYFLIAIVKKRLDLPGSLYTFLQVLSVTLFEKMLISPAFQPKDYTSSDTTNSNPLIPFEFNRTVVPSPEKTSDFQCGLAQSRMSVVSCWVMAVCGRWAARKTASVPLARKFSPGAFIQRLTNRRRNGFFSSLGRYS